MSVEIGWYTGPRAQLRSLFSLAEDSPQRLEVSLDRGRVLVATANHEIVAYLQLVEADRRHEVELRSMAVVEQRQRTGIGRALVARAVVECRAEGVCTLLLATASADTGNLRFYQPLGFRI